MGRLMGAASAFLGALSRPPKAPRKSDFGIANDPNMRSEPHPLKLITDAQRKAYNPDIIWG